MKKYCMAAALCCVLAALAGCARHSEYCDMDSDLVTLDNLPEPIDAQEDDPGLADAAEDSEAGEAEEKEFSAEDLARAIREIEENAEDESRIIQKIIADGYDEVPVMVSEAPAVQVEILPVEEVKAVDPVEAAESVDVAETAAPTEPAEYEKYLDIESYEAEEPAVAEAPVIETAVEEPIAEAPVLEEAIAEVEAPVLPVIVEKPVVEAKVAVAPEPVAVLPEKDDPFLLPPPLYSGPEPGREVFAAEVAADGDELSLDSLDDMDLEFFGSISESLLKDGREG